MTEYIDEAAWVMSKIEKEGGQVTLAREAEFMYVAATRSGRREHFDLPCDGAYWIRQAKNARRRRGITEE